MHLEWTISATAKTKATINESQGHASHDNESHEKSQSHAEDESESHGESESSNEGQKQARDESIIFIHSFNFTIRIWTYKYLKNENNYIQAYRKSKKSKDYKPMREL